MNKDEFYNTEDKDIKNLIKELTIANLFFAELNKDHIDNPFQKAFYEVIFTENEELEQMKEKIKKLVR